ncbi:MAG: RsmG family class I SAM-dependent methyltransferase [Ilumatobacteraceae bacterium]
MSDDTHLVSVLQLAKDGGVIGNTDLTLEISRARAFVDVIRSRSNTQNVLDIGSGGGLPGLVVAHDCPDINITLVDRREKRTDLLRRQSHRLRQHVPGRPIKVICADVTALHGMATFDVVTSRSFGSPDVVLDTALPLVSVGGHLLVSEPPNESGDRWPLETLATWNASIESWSTSMTSLAVIQRQ